MNPYTLSIGLVVQNLVFVAIACAVWRRQRLTPAEVGWGGLTARQMRLGLQWGLGLFSSTLVVGWLIERGLHLLLPAARYAALVHYQHAHSAAGEFVQLAKAIRPKPAVVLSKLIFVLVGSIAAPIGEEALFRGVVYRALRVRLVNGAAMVGSALLFALAHASPLSLGVLFFMGLMLALAYERTGSLWVPMLMHGVSNALMFLLLWYQTPSY